MVHKAATQAQVQKAATPAPVNQNRLFGAYFGGTPNGTVLNQAATAGLSRNKFLS